MSVGGIVAGIGGIVIVILIAFFLTGGVSFSVGNILQEISDSDVGSASVLTEFEERGFTTYIKFFNEDGDYTKAKGKVVIFLKPDNGENMKFAPIAAKFTFTSDDFFSYITEFGVKETVYKTPFYNLVEEYENFQGYVIVETNITLHDNTKWVGDNSFHEQLYYALP